MVGQIEVAGILVTVMMQSERASLLGVIPDFYIFLFG
jgi:hypothetical protein